MSNIKQIENLKQFVAKQQVPFEDLAKIHNAVSFKRESSFALQILLNPKNEYLASVAAKNPDSLKFAILNVAAIGLSLSPVHKLAYLLPRKNEVCLDISYRGLIQLAIDIRSIKWAQCFIVYEKDKFVLNGLGNEPTHETNPFDDNGAIKGVYITVKTHDDDFLTHTMKIADVYKIRDRSEAWKKDKSGPWKTDNEEMIKKTCARQASKWWPMTDTARKRFEEAIDVTNEADPIVEVLPEPSSATGEQVDALRKGLAFLNRDEKKYIEYLETSNKRKLTSLSDLTELELKKEITMMNHWVSEETKKRAAIVAKKTDEEINNELLSELDSELDGINENDFANK